MVIATEDNTTVEINPSPDLINGELPNIAFNINLQKGQIYQGLSSTDLTGTKIRSISTNTSPCKRIAVFSGSSKISICSSSRITNGGRGSADNLIQQAYPTASWGKNFITTPLISRDYDIFRIVISDPTTKVTLNGTPISVTQFVNNFYCEFKSQPTNIISADKPIQVVQYSVTEYEKYDGTSDLNDNDIGDPEMIYLNPLEQNIDHVTLYSTGKYKIVLDFINVIIPTAAVASFKLDGVSQAGAFTPVNNKPSYSYAQLNVDTGVTHFISASQGFNAIAYGFGQFESYGYAAGTNIKNLNEFVQFVDTATNKFVTTGCTGLGFIPQVTLPYITTRLIWDFGNNKKDTLLAPINTPLPPKADGTILYQYKYNKPITYLTPSIYSVKITATDPITTICGFDEDIYFNYTISDPPKAKFSARGSRCLTNTIGFKDLTDTTVNHIKSWHWNFGTLALPLVDTNYTLTVTLITDSLSFPVSDTITVKLLQPLVIPHTFTPNGDLINDTWKIKYLDTYPGCTVDVYDRNGAKVFSSIGYGIPWDGRFNYINLPGGTYYYIIDPKNGRDKISGSVTIIR